MDIVKFILNILTDVNKQLHVRFIYGLIFIILLFTVDNFLGLSYYYQKEKKITQVAQISSLLKDTTIDKDIRLYLKNEQKEIIERQNIKDYFLSFFSKVNLKNSTNRQTAAPSIASTIKNDFWMFLCSNIFIIIIMITTPFIAFKQKSTNYFKTLFAIIMLEYALFIISIVQYAILGIILLLFSPPIINYIVAIIYNIIWFWLTVKQNKK